MATPVRVRLADGAESGLANIVQQYLEQNLDESEQRRRRVHSSLRKPFLPLQVHGLMKLPPEERDQRRTRSYLLVAGVVAVMAVVVLLLLRS